MVPAATPIAALHGDLMAGIPFGRGTAPALSAPVAEPHPAGPADPGGERTLRSRRRGVLLGATYGAAMALVYGLLGLIVILTAGTFGTVNASPWFNAWIAVLFVVLGLGMALPWPIAGGGIAALPKPGAWMARVKQVFGVVILATATYYGFTA